MSILPRIHGLTVSVDYAEYLMVTGPLWLKGLTSMTVVTAPTDKRTVQVMRLLNAMPDRPSLSLFITDAFTRDGASFNKGLAMEEARGLMAWEDWILFFDVDVAPPKDWLYLFTEPLQMGYLYGSTRLETPAIECIGDLLMPKVDDDRLGYGYFQLFHSQDPKVTNRPLLDTHWRHAGNYDSNFMLGFRSMVKDVGFPVWHIGPQHENWFGKGKREDFLRMQRTRNGLGIHESEKL